MVASGDEAVNRNHIAVLWFAEVMAISDGNWQSAAVDVKQHSFWHFLSRHLSQSSPSTFQPYRNSELIAL